MAIFKDIGAVTVKFNLTSSQSSCWRCSLDAKKTADAERSWSSYTLCCDDTIIRRCPTDRLSEQLVRCNSRCSSQDRQPRRNAWLLAWICEFISSSIEQYLSEYRRMNATHGPFRLEPWLRVCYRRVLLGEMKQAQRCVGINTLTVCCTSGSSPGDLYL